ncbi:MAG: DNA polymerase III delta subunit [Glaciecola sp.]
MCLAHMDVDTIGESHVTSVIEGAGNLGSFAIADACLEDRDPGKTIALVRGAMIDGDAPLAILGLLIAKARDLMVARSGLDVGEARRRPDRGTAATKMNPGMVNRLKQSAAQWGVGELQWCHDRLARADLELKGNSELPPDIVLELALLDIATRRDPGAPWDPRVKG